MAKDTAESQPRYVIDQEQSRQKKVKILPDEQRKALEKVMQAGGHVLDHDERDVLLQLLDRLNTETDRLKALRKVAGDDRPLDQVLRELRKKEGLDADGRLHDEEPEVRKTTHVVGYRPEEVVRRYLQSWNQQTFGAEYDCFSKSFLNMSREDYINRRQVVYRQTLAKGGMKQKIGDLLSVDMSGTEAEVRCTKIVQMGNAMETVERDLYRLHTENNRWVIYQVEPL
ncbi:MAG TPA: hypothetical protein PK395_14370 [bacterium]|nr:hypothetical protein [bacterium]HQQ00292.1 hypothetical protein [bacterium]